MVKEECLFLGILQKPHGVAGGMILRSGNVLPENLDETDHVFINFDEILVPFFITSFTYRDDKSGIVLFDDVDDKSKTTGLIHKEVYARSKMFSLPEKELFLSDLIGYQLRDITSGFAGTIVAVDEIPGNPVVHVRAGEKERLVPYQEELIARISKKKKTIEMELPDGLLNL
jgi:16S rRNA processing protein RimM